MCCNGCVLSLLYSQKVAFMYSPCIFLYNYILSLDITSKIKRDLKVRAVFNKSTKTITPQVTTAMVAGHDDQSRLVDAPEQKPIVAQAAVTAVSMTAVMDCSSQDSGEETECSLKRKNAIRRRADSVTRLADLDGPGLSRSNAMRRAKTEVGGFKERDEPEPSTSALERSVTTFSCASYTCETALLRKPAKAPRKSRFVEDLPPVDTVSTTAEVAVDGVPQADFKMSSQLKNVFGHRPSYSGVQMYEGT